PWKEKGHLEIEDDEEDGDEVVPHVKLHARIVKRVEAALVSREFLRVRIADGNDDRRQHQRKPNHDRQREEDQDREIVSQEIVQEQPPSLGASGTVENPPAPSCPPRLSVPPDKVNGADAKPLPDQILPRDR